MAAIYLKRSRQAAMQYPTGFPNDLKRSVDKAIAEAEVEFSEAKRQQAGAYVILSDLERLTKKYIEKIVFAFGKSVCKAVEEGIWDGEMARSQMDTFIGTVSSDAYLKKCPDHGRSDGFGRFTNAAAEYVRAAPGWAEYQKELALALDAADNEPGCNAGHANDRRALIDRFISEVRRQTGRKIKRVDICLVAGYRDSTQFERFQRNDPRTTDSAIQNFSRVLRMSADQFVSTLVAKRGPN